MGESVNFCVCLFSFDALSLFISLEASHFISLNSVRKWRRQNIPTLRYRLSVSQFLHRSTGRSVTKIFENKKQREKNNKNSNALTVTEHTKYSIEWVILSTRSKDRISYMFGCLNIKCWKNQTNQESEENWYCLFKIRKEFRNSIQISLTTWIKWQWQILDICTLMKPEGGIEGGRVREIKVASKILLEFTRATTKT